jgi:hypothetical protein
MAMAMFTDKDKDSNIIPSPVDKLIKVNTINGFMVINTKDMAGATVERVNIPFSSRMEF